MTHAANAFMLKIVEKLEGIGQGAGWAYDDTRTITVERDEGSPLDREHYPLINIYTGAGKRVSDYDAHQTGVYHRTRMVFVEVWFESQSPDADSDKWLHDVERALGQDPQLDETCRLIRPVEDDRTLIDGRDGPLNLLGVSFEVTFGTERKDPSRSV